MLVSSVKMGVLGHLPNSPKSQIVRRVSFPIPPSVSKLPALAKNPEHFIYSLLLFSNAPNIYEKGKSPNLRKREIPNIYEKGKPPNSEISRMFYLTHTIPWPLH